jgi:hypothetical protein
MTDWGWKKENGTLSAIGTTEPPVPDVLLKKLFWPMKLSETRYTFIDE